MEIPHLVEREEHFLIPGPRADLRLFLRFLPSERPFDTVAAPYCMCVAPPSLRHYPSPIASADTPGREAPQYFPDARKEHGQ